MITTTLRNFLVRDPNGWTSPNLLNRVIVTMGEDPPVLGRPRLPAKPLDRARIELEADAGRCLQAVRR